MSACASSQSADVRRGHRERADHDRAVGVAGEAEAQAVDQVEERIEVRRERRNGPGSWAIE